MQHGFSPLGPIAAGAFSTIRHACVEPGHARLAAGREVAIKTWSVAACKRDASAAIARNNELAVLHRAAAHTHPHLANLLHIVNGPTYTHGVLEYCAGGSLMRHLQRLQTTKQQGPILSPSPGPATGAMEASQARWVICQVASALAYLHSIDIAHRDVKPANVLFYDTNRTQIKLCDFGFATFCGGRKLKMRCGTPLYQAPELVAGREYYGPPVDMWALGAMTYELLHGKPAFPGHSLSQIEQRIRSGNVSLSGDTPSDARAFVSACLTAHPSHRLTAQAGLTLPWLSVVDPSQALGQPRITAHAVVPAPAVPRPSDETDTNSSVGDSEDDLEQTR